MKKYISFQARQKLTKATLKLREIARSFDGLVDYGAHYRLKHSKNEFVNNHINGIENSKGYAKHRLAKFKGIENRISCFI